MEGFRDTFAKLAFVLLAVWIVMAALGKTTMPGKHKHKGHQATRNAIGGVWAVPVVYGPSAAEETFAA